MGEKFKISDWYKQRGIKNPFEADNKERKSRGKELWANFRQKGEEKPTYSINVLFSPRRKEGEGKKLQAHNSQSANANKKETPPHALYTETGKRAQLATQKTHKPSQQS